MIRSPRILALLFPTFVMVGCSNNENPVPQPQLDRLKICEAALAAYDADHDGAITGAEIDACPAFKQSLSRLDKDHDGRITSEEIAARVDLWRDREVATFPITCQVTLDRKPVTDATVTFVPEAFLGPEIKEATGKTNAAGMARISTAQRGKGVYIGWYRIKISKEENGQETIPAKYNAKTILGQEVASDNDALRGTLKLDLKSN